MTSHLQIFIFLSFLKFITSLEILEEILTNKANYQLNMRPSQAQQCRCVLLAFSETKTVWLPLQDQETYMTPYQKVIVKRFYYYSFGSIFSCELYCFWHYEVIYHKKSKAISSAAKLRFCGSHTLNSTVSHCSIHSEKIYFLLRRAL